MVLPEKDVLEGRAKKTLQPECLTCGPLIEQDGLMSYQFFQPEEVEAIQKRLARGITADPHVSLAGLWQKPREQTERVEPRPEIGLYGRLADRAQKFVYIRSPGHSLNPVGW